MSGWRIGFSQSGRVLRHSGPGHMLLVAPPRSKKAVSILVPMLLEPCKASRGIIDPKGELAAICAAQAAKFSEVEICNPFGILQKELRGFKHVGYNPLRPLDPKSNSFGSDVLDIVDGIFTRERGGGDENASFFNGAASELTGAVIRVVVKYFAQEQRNLVTVRKALASPFAFARKYIDCGDAFAHDVLEAYADTKAETRKSMQDVVMTAREQTAFIGREGIAESLAAKDGLNFTSMKKTRKTVFLILPLAQLGSCGKWFRLCMAGMLSESLRAGVGGRGLPLLVVCDEFFSIGPLRTFEACMSQAAGAAKLQLMPVLQSLAQLKTMYPNDAWLNFLACSAVQIFFGRRNVDESTARYVSDACGEREIVTLSRSSQYDHKTRDAHCSYSSSVHWEKLLKVHEFRAMNDNEMVALVDSVPSPIRGKRLEYFKDRRCHGYRPNPYYKAEGFFKRMVS